MKVDVQDVEEDGMIMLSPLQPQVGTPLQAVIIDLDGISTDTGGNPQAEYVWAKADTMTRFVRRHRWRRCDGLHPDGRRRGQLPPGDGDLPGACFYFTRDDGNGHIDLAGAA